MVDSSEPFIFQLPPTKKVRAMLEKVARVACAQVTVVEKQNVLVAMGRRRKEQTDACIKARGGQKVERGAWERLARAPQLCVGL